MSRPIIAPCPRCGVDLLHHGDVSANGWVPPSHDPEGKAGADLFLTCDACESRFIAFVALEDFVPLEDA